MMQIRLSKPYITNGDIKTVTQCLKEERLSQGKYVEMFERRFAEYVGAKHASAPFYRELYGLREEYLPITEDVADRILSLTMYTAMTKEEQNNAGSILRTCENC